MVDGSFVFLWDLDPAACGLRGVLEAQDALCGARRAGLAQVEADRAGLFFLLAGHLAAEFFLARISIVPLLVGLARTFWGKRRLRVLAFPLCWLATMAPLPAIVYNAIA